MNDSPHTRYDKLLHSMRTKGPRGLEHFYKCASKRFEKVVAVKPTGERFASIKPEI